MFYREKSVSLMDIGFSPIVNRTVQVQVLVSGYKTNG